MKSKDLQSHITSLDPKELFGISSVLNNGQGSVKDKIDLLKF